MASQYLFFAPLDVLVHEISCNQHDEDNNNVQLRFLIIRSWAFINVCYENFVLFVVDYILYSVHSNSYSENLLLPAKYSDNTLRKRLGSQAINTVLNAFLNLFFTLL